MEAFITTSGKRSSRRLLAALAKECKRQERQCTAAESDELVDAERVGFFFWLLASMASRGRSANRQLFFVSLVAQSRGLSRTGMEFFRAMNVCLPPRTFDLELNTFHSVVADRERSVPAVHWPQRASAASAGLTVCREVEAGVHVVWLDNFSKFYAIAVPVLASGACAECLWTARGLHRYVGPAVSTAMLPGVRGMPLSFFSPRITALFKAKMAAADPLSVSFLKDSLCFKHNVRKLPLKPDVDAAVDPALAGVLRESRDGMRNFFPLGMMPENIGSNRGLLLVLRQLYGVQPKPGHYSFLSVHCNLYLRLLKVH